MSQTDGRLMIGATCALSVVFMTTAPTAGAQNDPAVAAQSSEPASGDGTALQEIVVTAQRRKENLQTVPIAVTAVDAATLAASGVQSTQELSTLVPGLTFPSSVGYALPHIRGVGTTAVEAGVENSVALYVDGVYYASPAGSVLNLNNVSQVEVLKGPQGTLFGRNATGGLIQVTTLDPTSDFHGNASVGYGNYQTTAVDGYVTGGLSENFAADLAVQAKHQGEGYGTNLFNGEGIYKTDRDISVRSKGLWTPVEGTRVRLTLDYENSLTSNPLSLLPGTAAADVFYPATPGLLNAASGYDINQDEQPEQALQSGGASLFLDQELGFADLIAITAYRKEHFTYALDLDLGPLPLQSVVNHQDDSQFSEELQLQSHQSGPLQWTAGLYYLHLSDAYTPINILFGGTNEQPLGPGLSLTNALTNTAQKTDSVAGYGQATYEIVPSTRLTLGLRLTYEKKALDGTQTGVANGFIDLPFGAFDTRSSVTKPSWRFALDHRFTDQLMGYVSYNRGFKSGGYNLSEPGSAPYQTETLDAYELGLKTTALNERLRVNAAAFYYNYSNMQVTRFILGSPEVYNGATSRIYGVDLDLEAAVTEGLTLGAGLEALHDEFTSFPCTDYFAGGPGLNSPDCSSSPTPTLPYDRSATGNRLPDTPNFTANVSLNYHAALLNGETDFHVDDAFNSGYYPDPNNQLHQKAFNVLNASWRWSTRDERLFVRVWARNLADTRYTYELEASAIQLAESLAPPRTYGLTLGTKF